MGAKLLVLRYVLFFVMRALVQRNLKETCGRETGGDKRATAGVNM